MAKISGVEPFVTLDGLRMARHHMFFDDAKARRELGYASQALSRGPFRRDRLVSLAWRPQMIATAVSLLSLAVWAYLLFGRGWFWLCGERDDFVACWRARHQDAPDRLARRRGDHSRRATRPT